MEAIEAIIDKSQEALGNDHDWVSVDISDRPVYKFGDAKKKKQALSKVKVKVKVKPGGHIAHLNVHAQETEGVPVLLSAKSLTVLGAVINFETGQAIFQHLEPETVVQLDRSPAGHLWMDLFEQMPVVSENPWSLLGQVKTRGTQKNWKDVRGNRADWYSSGNTRPSSRQDVVHVVVVLLLFFFFLFLPGWEEDEAAAGS